MLSLLQENRPKVAKAEGVAALVGAAQAHPKHPLLQEHFAGAIRALAIHRDTSLGKIPEADGLKALSAALQNCHSPGAQEQACAAFRNLSAQPANRDKIFLAGGHDQVVAAMMRSPNSVAIQQEGAGSIRNMATAADACELLAAANCIDALTAALKNHRDQVTVQEQVITAIGNLSLTASLAPKLRESGCVEGIVASMREHLGEDSMQEQACSSLAKMLANAGVKERGDAVAAGAVEVLLQLIDLQTAELRRTPTAVDLTHSGFGR